MENKKYFIFRCSNNTHDECIRLGLFGQTSSMSRFVSKVKKGDILYLHNITDRTLEGPFIAESDGSVNIVPDAWGGGFPAQVKVRKLENTSSISATEAMRSGLTYSYQNRYFDFQIDENIGIKLSGDLSDKI